MVTGADEVEGTDNRSHKADVGIGFEVLEKYKVKVFSRRVWF